MMEASAFINIGMHLRNDRVSNFKQMDGLFCGTQIGM